MAVAFSWTTEKLKPILRNFTSKHVSDCYKAQLTNAYENHLYFCSWRFTGLAPSRKVFMVGASMSFDWIMTGRKIFWRELKKSFFCDY